MKFTVSSSQLRERLQILSQAIASKNSMAILDCFLFSLEGNRLSVTASNLESTIVASVDVENQGGDGKIAIYAKQLSDMLSAFGDQSIVFDIDSNSYSIKIMSDNGNYSFMGQNSAEYPMYRPLDENETASFTVKASALRDAIQQTRFAASSDDLRPILCGVCFDLKSEGLAVAATDAHILSKYVINNATSTDVRRVVLPLKPLNILKDILAKEKEEDVTIKYDNKGIFCELNGYLVVGRQVEGIYPNYETIIPQNNPVRAIVNRAALMSALNRVQVCISSATSLVKIAFSKDNINLSGQDFDFSSAGEENVSCQYDGEPMEIGFKANLVINVLRNIQSTDVVIELSDRTRPGIFLPYEQKEGTEALMLLMPMMLN